MMQLLKEEVALGQKQAAAEDLYSALEALITIVLADWEKRISVPDYKEQMAMHQAYAAIAKAEGRS